MLFCCWLLLEIFLGLGPVMLLHEKICKNDIQNIKFLSVTALLPRVSFACEAVHYFARCTLRVHDLQHSPTCQGDNTESTNFYTFQNKLNF